MIIKYKGQFNIKAGDLVKITGGKLKDEIGTIAKVEDPTIAVVETSIGKIKMHESILELHNDED